MSGYIADCDARQLRSETLRKYSLLAPEMVEEFGGRPAEDGGIDELSQYREVDTFVYHPLKEVERLRAFFKSVSNGNGIRKIQHWH